MQSPRRVASQNAPPPTPAKTASRQNGCQKSLNGHWSVYHRHFLLLQVCVEPRPSVLNMTLPAFAAECGRRSEISIDICCPRPNLCSAANQPHAAVAVDRRDRRTDGRTPDHYIDPTPHTMRVASIKPHHAYAYKSRGYYASAV